jgi:rRNA maturation endonuclease Nob1
MSLFSDAGRAFERTKQALTGDDGPEYVCRACEELVEEDYEFCPHCGEAAVEPLE